jgi:hypothetical protein
MRRIAPALLAALLLGADRFVITTSDASGAGVSLMLEVTDTRRK